MVTSQMTIIEKDINRTGQTAFGKASHSIEVPYPNKIPRTPILTPIFQKCPATISVIGFLT